MRLWMLGSIVGGTMGFFFGWTGLAIVIAVLALGLAWTLGRLHEANVSEKMMMRGMLEAYCEFAEETLASVPPDEDLDDEERHYVQELKDRYHKAQNTLKGLR